MRCLSLLACLALSGCLTLKYDESKADALAGYGYASIRGSQEKIKSLFVGPRIVRYFVTAVDDPSVAAKGPDDILALTLGERRVTAEAYIQLPRFRGFDLYRFAGTLHFTAAAGRRYELRGQGTETYAELGVYDMADGGLVSELCAGVPVLAEVERAPAIIFLP
jgi:hypothetical protein